jgi:hypothetical protein
MYAEVNINREVNGNILMLDGGNTTDFIVFLKLSTSEIRIRIRRASGSTVNIITSSVLSRGVHKIALGYKNGDYALYIDGNPEGTSSNSTDYPATALTRALLSSSDYAQFNDRIRSAALYTTRLTDSELAALTT